MSACFEGKETEHNWIMREKAIIKVRGMIKADIQKQYPQPLVSCLKAGFLANSVKAVRCPLRVPISSLGFAETKNQPLILLIPVFSASFSPNNVGIRHHSALRGTRFHTRHRIRSSCRYHFAVPWKNGRIHQENRRRGISESGHHHHPSYFCTIKGFCSVPHRRSWRQDDSSTSTFRQPSLFLHTIPGPIITRGN